MAKAKRGQAADQGSESAQEAVGQQEQPPVTNNGGGLSGHGTNGNGQRARPAYEHRIGRIRVIAWRNDGKEGPWYSFSVTRGYKDQSGNWKTATTLGRDDLLTAALMMQGAYLWAAEQQSTNGNSTPAPQPSQNGTNGGGGAMTGEDIPF